MLLWPGIRSLFEIHVDPVHFLHRAHFRIIAHVHSIPALLACEPTGCYGSENASIKIRRKHTPTDTEKHKKSAHVDSHGKSILETNLSSFSNSPCLSLPQTVSSTLESSRAMMFQAWFKLAASWNATMIRRRRYTTNKTQQQTTMETQQTQHNNNQTSNNNDSKVSASFCSMADCHCDFWFHSNTFRVVTGSSRRINALRSKRPVVSLDLSKK